MIDARSTSSSRPTVAPARSAGPDRRRLMTIPLTELDIDPSVPGFFLRPDYYDVLGRLRAEAPLFEATPGTRLVSRYDDIREISRDPGRFCSSRGVLVNDPMREGLAIEGSILHTDPPRHGEYRRLLNREFTPRAVGGMEPRIRARTRDLLDAIPRGEEVDLVDVLAAPLPVTVIADVLGVAESDRSEFRRWSDAAIVASDGRADLPTEDAVAVGELVSFLGALAEAKRADPGDDVVSLLVDREIGGARLSPGELMTFNMSLLVAGNETTRHLISGGFLALAEHPDQRRRLAADPSLMPGAVEELLRWVTPIQQFARTVVADTTVGDDGPGELLDGGHPPQELLDCSGHQRRIGREAAPLVRMFGQREEPTRDEVASGLVARHEERHVERHELAGRESRAADLAVDEQ